MEAVAAADRYTGAMNNAVQAITWQGLVLASIPTFFVLLLMWRWAAGAGTALYATARMLVQLLLIGYVLVYIFEAGEASIIMAVLGVMLLAASWISIRPVAQKSRRVYAHALLSIAVSGVLTLALVSQAVIGVEPWFSPRYLVPLAGMIFAGAMNTVSLAAERAYAEAARGVSFRETRRIAMQAALIDAHERGHQQGLQWIWNTLVGPGLLPDFDEAKAMGGAQAWFDAKTAESEALKRSAV